MKLFDKLFGAPIKLSSDERRRASKIRREDEAAVAYRHELLFGSPLVEPILEQYSVTRQGLLNGWVRSDFGEPPFMREDEFIGEEE